MNEPSQETPGCRHRKLRHDLETCEYLANLFPEERRRDVIVACVGHIHDGCESGRVSASSGTNCDDAPKLLRELLKEVNAE